MRKNTEIAILSLVTVGLGLTGCDSGSRRNVPGRHGTVPTTTTPGTTTPGSTAQLPAGTYFQENFDTGTPQFQMTGLTTWEVGTPNGTGAFSAPGALATVVAGNYRDNVNEQITTNPIDLTAATAPRLRFKHAFDFERNFDGGRVLVSTNAGQTFAAVTPTGGYSAARVVGLTNQAGYTGTAATFADATFDLTQFAGQTIVIAFQIGTDGSIVRDGWAIDEIVVDERPGSNPGGPAPTAVYTEDFEGQAVSMSESGSVWEFGTPSGAPTGPTAAAQGTRCAGTNIDGNYANSQNGILMTPDISLTGRTNITLTFKSFVDVETVFDGCRVQVVTGTNPTPQTVTPTSPTYDGNVVAFQQQPGWSNQSRQFVDASFDLSQFAGQTIRIIFQFGSDSSIVGSGWYVDDVRVTAN